MRLLIPSERAQAPSLRFAIEHLAWVETNGQGARPAGSQALESLFDDCRSQGGPAAGTALETIRKKQTQAAQWPSMRALSCLAAENYALQMGRNGLERNAFNYGHVSALVSRIRAFMDDERFKTIVNTDGGAPVQTPLSMELEAANLTNDIFGKANFEKHDRNVHILDLSRFAPDLMPFVLGSLLEMLASQLFVRGPGQTHPTLLILEEAHHYLRQLPGTDDGAGQMRAYERLAKEGRKFGLSLLVSTQRPSELSPTVLAQCGTWAVFRLSNEADQKAVAAATETARSHVIFQVAGLGRGEAIVFGAATKVPSRFEHGPFCNACQQNACRLVVIASQHCITAFRNPSCPVDFTGCIAAACQADISSDALDNLLLGLIEKTPLVARQAELLVFGDVAAC
jgi:hypothetical protein